MAFRPTVLARLARIPILPRHSSISSTIIRQPIRSASSNTSNPFQSMPSPPRLPPDQQAEFERLQHTANTQEGFNPTSTPDFSSPASNPNLATTGTPSAVDGRRVVTPAIEDEFASVPLRKGAPPEFEGDINPKTGEVGGPKNEPLRWGAGGDYSFNGRVTDF
ncbi:DUF1674-domain-containing protein [Hypoxylon trugodes]|uniref:DUF1674-domain-containing protein n=1 Tax=Hypoxylon trugodes TaxID=326681 RepID=UPI002198678E|nr:DUF1674-domain-containing protein [Hypoxylon trugodes]KAI1382896.1 DUF1674-domain-containing protein [Hypoxylon trugodes]